MFSRPVNKVSGDGWGRWTRRRSCPAAATESSLAHVPRNFRTEVMERMVLVLGVTCITAVAIPTSSARFIFCDKPCLLTTGRQPT